MPSDPVKVVCRGLQVYADRGVFRGFDEAKTRGETQRFRFVWLGSRLLSLSVNPRKGVLRFDNLLPTVPF